MKKQFVRKITIVLGLSVLAASTIACNLLSMLSNAYREPVPAEPMFEEVLHEDPMFEDPIYEEPVFEEPR